MVCVLLANWVSKEIVFIVHIMSIGTLITQKKSTMKMRTIFRLRIRMANSMVGIGIGNINLNYM